MIFVSDRTIEKSPMMTPDSLRQFLKMNKGLYDLHTDKNYGLNDTGGIQYVGTVENFGSEILLESNKLRLKKPPIDSLTIPSVIRFYFDLKFYDELTEYGECYMYQNGDKFSKQNMVCGLLHTNRLIDGYEYKIIFNNVNLVYHLGSYTTSDNVVRRMPFFETTTPPVLRVTDRNNVSSDIDMTIDDGSEVDTIYYFPINLMTIDLLGMSVPRDDIIFQIEQSKTFEIDINNCKHDDIPYFWFCVDRFKKLPEFTMTGNTSYSEAQSLLTPGMDGNGIIHLYPSAGNPPDVPSSLVQEGCKWWIKAYGDFSYNMEPGSIRDVTSGTINRIEYIYDTTYHPQQEPVFRRSITYNADYFKIELNVDDRSLWSTTSPSPGDYDYDPYTDLPVTYAIVELSEFENNKPDNISNSIINSLVELKPAFDVKADDRKYVDYFEQKMNHSTSGMHIDYTTDNSYNGISKLCGIVHDLGKFDGLPSYYQEWNQKAHRSHVELYAIRDSIFKNQDPMERQTAGLIIDAAIPQVDVVDMDKDAKIRIKYQNEGLFETIDESGSPTNYLSDLGYYDNQTFVWTGMIEYVNAPKFIYHGQGIFSLGVQGFDPETEIGRVYLITNDPIVYENNSETDYPKPSRTAARICDIPTSFVQLINIKNISPTYALDPYYTRMGASWGVMYGSNGYDEEELLWNKRTPIFIAYNNKYVFENEDNLDNIISEQYMRDNYSIMTNFDRKLDMTHPSSATEYSFSICVAGEPNTYQVNDKINIVLGGINFRGTITGVDQVTGYVNDVTIEDMESVTMVNIGNIPSRISQLKTTAVDGIGEGLIMYLTVDATVWDNLHMKKSIINPDVYVLKKDNNGRIWAWNFITHNWKQHHLVTGEDYPYNYYYEQIGGQLYYYEIHRTYTIVHKVSTKLPNVMLYNYFKSEFTYLQPITTPRRENVYDVIDASKDINSDLSDDLINNPETFYIVYDGQEGNHNIAKYHLTRASDEKYELFDRRMLPEHHNIKQFYAYTPSCKLTCDSINHNELTKQTDVYVYNPIKSLKYSLTNKVYNESMVVNKSNYTLKDILETSWFSGDVLTHNLYSYSFTNDIKTFNEQREYLTMLGRSRLLELIYQYDPHADPIEFEGSDSEYTLNELVDFIIERQRFTNNVKCIAYKGTDYHEIQEIGGYTKLQNVYDGKLTTRDGKEIESFPTDVYKLDYISEVELSDFRMYDDLGNDVSKYCMILIEDKLYAFHDGKWIRIKTRRG